MNAVGSINDADRNEKSFHPIFGELFFVHNGLEMSGWVTDGL